MSRLHFSPNQKHWLYSFAILTTLCALSLIIITAYATLLGPQASHSLIVSYQWSCLLLTLVSVLILSFASLMAARYFSLGPFLICLCILPALIIQLIITDSLDSLNDPALVVTLSVLQLIVVSLLWWICKITWPASYAHSHYSLKNLRPFAWIALILLWLEVLFTMAFNVQATSNSCSIFPYCANDLIAFFQFKKTFFILVYLHMYRALIYGSYKKPRELLWLIGMGIYITLLLEAFTGYVLPWGQMSYWGAEVITSFASALPWVGKSLVVWFLPISCARHQSHPDY